MKWRRLTIQRFKTFCKREAIKNNRHNMRSIFFPPETSNKRIQTGKSWVYLRNGAFKKKRLHPVKWQTVRSSKHTHTHTSLMASPSTKTTSPVNNPNPFIQTVAFRFCFQLSFLSFSFTNPISCECVSAFLLQFCWNTQPPFPEDTPLYKNTDMFCIIVHNLWP